MGKTVQRASLKAPDV